MRAAIDILMAVYNGADYILDQLHSLMEQTYPHFRIIIRDNCSQDQTVSLIEEFSRSHPGKIKLIKGTENLGALGNFATLVDYAEAHYIMFSDADDKWLPSKVGDTLALMQKNESLYGKETPLLIHTDLRVVDRDLKTLGSSFWSYSKLKPDAALSFNRLLVHNVVTGCTMMINRPLLNLAAPIPKEAIMHDWWLALTASAFGKIDYLPLPTILYRQHGRNDTGAKNWRSLSTYAAAFKKASSTEGRKQMRSLLIRTIRQSSVFLARYGRQCNPKERLLLESYAKLETGNLLQKRAVFLRHRFFKNTLVKNIGMFLLL